MNPVASWTFEPVVLLGVAAAGWLYLRRWRQIAAEVGPARAGRRRAASFLAGLGLILVALVSPIDRLSDQLFFVHMIQHVLLLDLVPILLICGLTKLILRPVTRRLHHIERAAGPLGDPIFAVVLYVATVWGWHVPAMYDAALAHSAIHVLEHTSYSVAGSLYWWHLLSPIRSRRRLAGMGPALYMAATKLLVGLLGITLVFSTGALYAFYTRHTGFWGLSAHADQALAGGIMALEQSLVMGVALAFLFARMLTESEREAVRAELAAERSEDRPAGGPPGSAGSEDRPAGGPPGSAGSEERPAGGAPGSDELLPDGRPEQASAGP